MRAQLYFDKFDIPSHEESEKFVSAAAFNYFFNYLTEKRNGISIPDAIMENSVNKMSEYDDEGETLTEDKIDIEFKEENLKDSSLAALIEGKKALKQTFDDILNFMLFSEANSERMARVSHPGNTALFNRGVQIHLHKDNDIMFKCVAEDKKSVRQKIENFTKDSFVKFINDLVAKTPGDEDLHAHLQGLLTISQTQHSETEKEEQKKKERSGWSHDI